MGLKRADRKNAGTRRIASEKPITFNGREAVIVELEDGRKGIFYKQRWDELVDTLEEDATDQTLLMPKGYQISKTGTWFPSELRDQAQTLADVLAE